MARLAGGSPGPRVAGRGGYNLFPGLSNGKESKVTITRLDVVPFASFVYVRIA